MNLGHGGNVSEISRKYNINKEKIIDFSANINPLGMSDKVKNEIIKGISTVEKYPDITYYDLKKKIGNYDNVKVENIFLGNGAAEVIFNIARGLKPKKALIPSPTFSEYEDGLKSVGAEVKHYIMNDEFVLDSNFIENIKGEIDIIFICNPNNPTGMITTKEYLEKVIIKARENNTIVVVDESFLDFVRDEKNISVIRLIDKYDNLIIVKSLTKFFAIPGIRLGYGVTGNKEYIDKINRVAVPWSINAFANIAGIVALEETQYIEESIQYIEEEKEFLFNELNRFKKLKVYKGSVNFIFFKVLDCINLKEELIKKEILIRDCSNYIGLEKGFYRVAVKKREDNLKLIEGLKSISN